MAVIYSLIIGAIYFIVTMGLCWIMRDKNEPEQDRIPDRMEQKK
jgi:hypothetical protein